MQRKLTFACLVLAAAVATPRLFSADSRAPYQVVHGWPELPEGFAFGQVSGVGVDTQNHVWVFHRGDHPVMCFDGASGKLLASWGDGLIGMAHGLTVDKKDNVWITDLGHHQVFKFSNGGELLMAVGAKDVPGVDSRHFNQPTDVAVAETGEFYVADGYRNNRVAKFDADGKFLLDWGTQGEKPGEFDLPHGIALDAQGRVYVADRGNSRIQVFDRNGKFLHLWKSDELGRPWGLTVSSDGFLYMVDGGDLKPKPPGRGRVIKLDLQGKILEKWGTFGRYDGQFYWGHDIAVGKTGDLYVTDVDLGMRVQKFVRR